MGIRTSRKRSCFNCRIKGHESEDCKSENLGKKSFNCSKFGHISRECTEADGGRSNFTNKAASVNLITVTEDTKLHKDFEIANVVIEGYLDMGSMVTFIQENIYKCIEVLEFRQTDIVLVGIGSNGIKPIGFFRIMIEVGGEEYPLTIYVTPDGSAPVNAAIGNYITSHATVSIGPDKVTIAK